MIAQGDVDYRKPIGYVSFVKSNHGKFVKGMLMSSSDRFPLCKRVITGTVNGKLEHMAQVVRHFSSHHERRS